RIAEVLESLNADLLEQLGCWFGGGTAIVLRRQEYRESVDIDFMVSESDGYRELRQLLRSATSLQPLTHKAAQPVLLEREARIDQYGIRGFLLVRGSRIKFEIVREARIEFDVPTSGDQVGGIHTLTLRDLGASKLLANSDRWRDD